VSAVLREPSILRVPPHSIEAEASVLGGIMLAPDALAKVADWIKPEDFYRREHRLIFQAITELAGKRQPFDAVTLAEWFQRNGDGQASGYAMEIAGATAGAANIVAWAEIVAEKAKLRTLIETGTQLAGGAFDGGTDSESLVANAVHQLTAMQANRARGGLESAKVALKSLYARMTESWADGPKLLGLPTPWHDLNERLNGLRDGNVYIIAGRPSMGKSVMGGQLAFFNALRGNRTAWFSVEMTAEECAARAVACLADVDYRWVEQPDAQHPDADMNWAAVGRANEALLAAPLLIDATPGTAIAQVMGRARRAHMQAALRLIVIDHMHDMKIDPKQARFDYGAIVQGGKELAKEFRCPVVIIAQLNREAPNRASKRPTLTDLRESGEIEQKADVVLLLHREDYYESTQMPGAAEVIIGKGRNIARGEPIILRHRFDRMRFEDWVGPKPTRAIQKTPEEKWRRMLKKREPEGVEM
jgi:replicative DNA helicase